MAICSSAADLVLTSPGGPATDDDAEQEAVAALVALNYKPQEASRMVGVKLPNRVPAVKL